MRIALVSQEFPPETARGGIGTQTDAKAQGLVSLGHEVHVLSHSPTGRATHRRDGAVHVHRVPGMDDRLTIETEPVRWLTWSTSVAAALQELHGQAAFDLIDFPEWGAEGYVHLLNRTPWNRVRAVIQLHGPLVMLAQTMGWPERGSEFYRTGVHMEGTCLRLADAVYSSSRCSADWCAREYGLDDPHHFAGPFTRVGTRAKFRDVIDGLSNTIFFGEIRPDCSEHAQNGWAASNNGNGYCTTIVPINYETCDPNHPDACHRPCNWNTEVGFKSAHEGGAHFLLGDGSVRFISENIDHQMYQYLGAKNDGKVAQL